MSCSVRPEGAQRSCSQISRTPTCAGLNHLPERHPRLDLKSLRGGDLDTSLGSRFLQRAALAVEDLALIQFEFIWLQVLIITSP